VTSLLLPSSSSTHTSAASRDHSLRLWDVRTHTAIACLTGSTSPLTSVHFSPSSAVVAAACADGSIRLWSTSSGTAVAALAGHTSAAACCMAWSSDEALAAAAAGDGSVGVWQAATGLRRVRARVRPAVVVAAGVACSERQRGAGAVER
jgi:WD40 repeat protein